MAKINEVQIRRILVAGITIPVANHILVDQGVSNTWAVLGSVVIAFMVMAIVEVLAHQARSAGIRVSEQLLRVLFTWGIMGPSIYHGLVQHSGLLPIWQAIPISVVGTIAMVLAVEYLLEQARKSRSPYY